MTRVMTVLLLVLALPLAGLARPLGAQGGLPGLQPGDGIRLRVIGGQAEWSGEFPVDERLVVVLPKIGEWSVAGIPADSIRPRLLKSLGEFLVSTSVEVTPYRRIAIAGEVQKPGLYPIDAGMSVGEAIILAAGTTRSAREGIVEIRRLGAARGTPVPLETRVWAVPLTAGDMLVVPPRSWLRRNGLQIVTTTVSIASAISFILWQQTRQ